MKRFLSGLGLVLGFVATVSAVGIDQSTSFPSKLGVWTVQKEAALAWARANNAITIVIVGDHLNCGKCKAFDTATLSNTTWKQYVAAHNLALVYWDRPTLGDSAWYAYAAANTIGGQFPTVGIYGPSGQRLEYFLARDSKKTPEYIIGLLNKWVGQFPGSQPPGTVGFAASALTVAEDAGSAVVTVARTGGTGEAQDFGVTASAGAYNGAVSQTLHWNTGEGGSKTVSIPIIDDGVYTTPTSRTFTVTLAKTSGTATLGAANATITVLESIPYAPGELGFTAGTLSVSEADVATAKVSVNRVNGSVGAISVSYAVSTGGVAATSGTLNWAAGDVAAKDIALSAFILDTAPYDGIREGAVITLSAPTGTPPPTLGQATATVLIRDKAITQTLAEFEAEQGYPAGTFEAVGDWFYNEDLDALRSAPLDAGAETALTFAAPQAGLLTIAYGSTTAGGETALGVWNTVSGIGEVTNVLALAAGQVIELIAGNVTVSGYVSHGKVIAWEPVLAASSPQPAAGASFLLAEFGSKSLTWTAQAGFETELFTGRAPAALASQGVSVSGPALSAAGITATQGAVYWRVDTKAAGDFDTAFVVAGPVWSFTVIDKPTFENNGLPPSGGTATIYAKTTVAIDAHATRAVGYTANFGGLTGLKIGSDGQITGTPKKYGTFTVTVTATDAGGRTSTVAFKLTVAKTPVGKYNAILTRGSVLAGTVTLSGSSTGKVTAKVLADGKTVSLKGVWVSKGDGSLAATLEGRNTAPVAVLVSGGQLSGSRTDGLALVGQPANTGGGAYAGYYTVALDLAAIQPLGGLGYRPDGYGYLTLTVSRTGAARYAGSLPDGTKLSGSVPVYAGLHYQGSFNGVAIYKALYATRGAVSTLLPFTGNGNVALSGLWAYPGKAGGADAFAAALDGAGALYNKAAGFTGLGGSVPYVNGERKTATVAVQGGKLSLNPASGSGVTLKGTVSTGLISGKVDHGGKAYSFKGVAVPSRGLAVGAYVVPHPAGGTYKQSLPVEFR
jgi:hypothetical protein